MGGMIAQEMAIHHPERVRTLTSIMSSTGHPELPPPKPEAQAVLVTPFPFDREGYLEYSLKTWRLLSGSGFPIDEDRIKERAGRSFDRGLSLAGTVRQLAAILASDSRREALHSVTVPSFAMSVAILCLLELRGAKPARACCPCRVDCFSTYFSCAFRVSPPQNAA